LVLVTEWEQFRALDFKRLKAIMASAVFVDLKNVYQPADVAEAGFVYESIGRPAGD
jgi:UDPglucose 6-dehydrogenase